MTRTVSFALLLAATVSGAPVVHVVVNTAGDTPGASCGGNGLCSLRGAVQLINNVASNGNIDTHQITVPAGIYVLAGPTSRLVGLEDFNVNGDLDIRANVVIKGAGPAATEINGGFVDRVFDVFDGWSVTLDSMAITRGLSQNAGGGLRVNRQAQVTLLSSRVHGHYANNGGGIWNLGDLIVRNSTIENNNGGYWGGGIFNEGPLTVESSTISANTALRGGGIHNGGGNHKVLLVNVTLSGNARGTYGAALYSNGDVELLHVTVANNTVPAGDGSALFANAGSINLRNSIIDEGDRGCKTKFGTGINALAHNIESGQSCFFPCLGCTNVPNTDPQLQALANNGGPTKTHALRSTSPALDRISTRACTACPRTDQRGVARPQDGRFWSGLGLSLSTPVYDVGAFELVPPPPIRF